MLLPAATALRLWVVPKKVQHLAIFARENLGF
jgi:hypothetical protein